MKNFLFLTINLFLSSTLLALDPSQIVKEYVHKLKNSNPDKVGELIVEGTDPHQIIHTIVSLRFYSSCLKEVSMKYFGISESEYDAIGNTKMKSFMVAPVENSVSTVGNEISFLLEDNSHVVLIEFEGEWKMDVSRSFTDIDKQTLFFIRDTAPDLILVIKYFIYNIEEYGTVKEFKYWMDIGLISFLMNHDPKLYEELKAHPNISQIEEMRTRIISWNNSIKEVDDNL